MSEVHQTLFQGKGLVSWHSAHRNWGVFPITFHDRMSTSAETTCCLDGSRAESLGLVVPSLVLLIGLIVFPSFSVI